VSYRLHPPGTRGGNKVFYATFSVGGRRREVSTKTRDRGLAERFAARFERLLYERDLLGAGPPRTLGQAIEAYVAFRRPGANDRRYLDLLKRWAGRRPLAEIGQADFDRAAQALYPGRAPETWNRQVYTPLQAVLGHAGVTLRLRRPRQRRPRNRAVERATAELLIATAGDARTGDPELAALLAVLFFTGCRISEAVALTWDRVDLAGRRVRFDLAKNDRDHWRPLHDRAFTALAGLPRGGRVFRWRTTSGPRKPLSALTRRLGVHFTPHMARHSFATWLADAGAGLKDVMDAGGWSDHKSVLRYTGGDVERVRRAVDRL
jgi:integrase